MKFRGNNFSKRTLALLAATVLMFGTGGVLGTKAALTVRSDNYDASLTLDHLSVQLTENGKTIGGEDGKEGTLFADLEGKAEPGKPYSDSIGVANDGGADEYVRVVVHKYWTDASGKKDKELNPDLIILKPEAGWKEVKETAETTTYYLSSPLASKGKAELFKTLRVDPSVTDKKTASKETKNGKTVFTYSYDYNGYTFNVEAEAQSVQTHNSKEAIKSVWGVDASAVGINAVD